MTNVTGATGRFKNFDMPNILKQSPEVNPDAKVSDNYSITRDLPSDSFVSSAPKNENTMKISYLRLGFNRLKNEQIDEINKTGKLPKNAKFVRTAGGNFKITADIFHIKQGTKTLPAGYEVRKSIFGFTKVVPKDTQGLFLKSNLPKETKANKKPKEE